MNKPLILQISIPFCVKQCSFCSYPYCTYEPRTVNAYTQALRKEIQGCAGEFDDYKVCAVSIEGGSPALLGADALYHVLMDVKKSFSCSEDVQVSLQTMPGDYSRALMEKMRDAGVNRWIIGLQTARRSEHDLLERPYKYEAITMADMAIRTFDPRSLSFDLLVGIPGQTCRSLEQTLSRCLYYAPEHMTVYPLHLPANCRMEEQIRSGVHPGIDGDCRAELMTFAGNWLTERGFRAYTRCDFAKPGFEDRYRVLSLQGCERLGLGYHSSSWLDGVFWTTGHSLQEYIEHSDDIETIAVDMIRPDEESLSRIYDPLQIRLDS